MERSGKRYTVRGARPDTYAAGVRSLTRLFGRLMRASGLEARGVRNALDVRLRRLEFRFAGLPAAFDGYRILHVTDPHFDALEGTLAATLACLDGVEAELGVLTGDYRRAMHGPFGQILPCLERLLAAMAVRDGVYATLGNHDETAMVPAFEALGIRMLINETVALVRGDAVVHLTGLDDVHEYYSEDAPAALRAAAPGFGIALVHSAEMAGVAAGAGYHLYLAGHTHGGQICLPGGWPVVRGLVRHGAFVRGRWRCGRMHGYTSCGAGVTMLPVRFNTRGEVTLITLRRAD